MKNLTLIIVLFLSINVFAQNGPSGLWGVNKVMVGDRDVTPTAKWFAFQEDGSLTSGNGNIENFSGFYQYDASRKELTQNNGNAPDPYGPFQIELTNSHMTWERMEDGMKVVVQLTKVDKKPKAPWDLLQGGWTMSKSEGADPETGKVKSTYDTEKERYFFMWDRAYRKFNSSGQQIETGVWHIGAHSHEIWTITNADNTKTKWELAFDGDTMIWSRINGTDIIKMYFERDND